MLPSLVAFLALEAATSVAAEVVLPAFLRRVQHAGWPGRVLLCGLAVAAATAAATRPLAARRIVQSVALSQLPRATAALARRSATRVPAA